MPMNGIALAGLGGGILLLYSAIKGTSILQEIPALIQGKSPSTLPDANAINTPNATASNTSPNATSPGLINVAGFGNTGASSNTAAQNQALAKQLAVSMGHSDWTTGAEWLAWLSLWNQESNWQDEANPTSTARGIAQNIDGYGPNYQQGNMPQQITWGIDYIESRYGDPIAAWAHEVTHNWY